MLLPVFDSGVAVLRARYYYSLRTRLGITVTVLMAVEIMLAAVVDIYV
jgi:hypothetical protein